MVNDHATDGVAIAECRLYDEKGPIGSSSVAALAQRRPMTIRRRRKCSVIPGRDAVASPESIKAAYESGRMDSGPASSTHPGMTAKRLSPIPMNTTPFSR